MVLKDHAKEAESFFDFAPVNTSKGDVFTCFSFYEVNYGTLPFLGLIMNAGIPFDADWGPGSEYGPGSHFCRYTAEGELQEIERSNEYKNPDIDELMKLIDDPDALIKKIIDHHKSVTPLPWENQMEHAKLFRTKKLIST
jgi:hypothetical protein